MLEKAALLTLAALVGGMVAFSARFAPLVFRKLRGETAAGFMRGMFRWYYLFGPGLSGLARQLLMPAINRGRDRQVGMTREQGDASSCCTGGR